MAGLNFKDFAAPAAVLIKACSRLLRREFVYLADLVSMYFAYFF